VLIKNIDSLCSISGAIFLWYNQWCIFSIKINTIQPMNAFLYWKTW